MDESGVKSHIRSLIERDSNLKTGSMTIGALDATPWMIVVVEIRPKVGPWEALDPDAVSKLESSVAILTEENAELRADNEKLDREVQRLKEQNAKLEGENGSLRSNLEVERREIDRYKGAQPFQKLEREPERCELVCPHGDRCVRERDHDNGCSHRGCDCNEPNEPIDQLRGTDYKLDYTMELTCPECGLAAFVPDGLKNDERTHTVRKGGPEALLVCGNDGHIFAHWVRGAWWGVNVVKKDGSTFSPDHIEDKRDHLLKTVAVNLLKLVRPPRKGSLPLGAIGKERAASEIMWAGHALWPSDTNFMEK